LRLQRQRLQLVLFSGIKYQVISERIPLTAARSCFVVLSTVLLISACSQDGRDIRAVKEHPLDSIGSLTVSQAIDYRPGCATTEWRKTTDEAGRALVDYVCTIDLPGDPFASMREREIEQKVSGAKSMVDAVQREIDQANESHERLRARNQGSVARATRDHQQLQGRTVVEFGDPLDLLRGIRDKLQSPDSSIEEKTLALASIPSELSLLRLERHEEVMLVNGVIGGGGSYGVPQFSKYWDGVASQTEVDRLHAWVNDYLDSYIAALDRQILRIEDKGRRLLADRRDAAEAEVIRLQRSTEEQESRWAREAEIRAEQLRGAKSHLATIEITAELEALNKWPRFDALFHVYRWLIMEDQVYLIAEGYLAEHKERGTVKIAGDPWFNDPTSDDLYSRIQGMRLRLYGTNGIAAKQNDSAERILDNLLLRMTLREHGFAL